MEIVKRKHGLGAPGRSKRRRFALLALIGLAYSALLIATGAKMHQNAFFSESVMPFLRASRDWPVKWTESFSAKPPHLAIDMTWESFQRLAYDRERALQVGSLFVSSDDYVRATVTTDDGQSVNVKMRLKGDGVDHLRGDKWSFRVRTRGNKTILGLKQFSLHHPRVRNWLFEWLAQRAMKREGVISLRYDFVDVSLNGKSLGIYALEEHFEKRLIEHNQRREGPVVRFTEDLMWHEIVDQHRPFEGSDANGAGSYLASGVDGFQTGKTLSDEKAKAQYLRAVNLLELFRRGELTTSDVFDVPILAKYFALTDLFGAEHGARWNNIRLYYNPVSGLLEPIAFDMQAGKPTHAISLAGRGSTSSHGRLVSRSDGFTSRMFEDAAFCEAYLRELTRVSKLGYLDKLLAETETDRKEALAILYSEFPYYEFSPDVLYRNQRYIESVLDIDTGISAYAGEESNGRLPLQIANIQPLPLEVVGIVVDDATGVDLPEPLLMRPRKRDAPLQFTNLTIELPTKTRDGKKRPSVSVRYRVPGTDRVLTTRAEPFALALDAQLAEIRALRTPTTSLFEFIQVDEAAKTIRIMPGQWPLRQDLIIPAGYTVSAAPGAQLDLLESAMILSRSPLQLLGTEDKPIVIHSSDKTGQGLAVLSAGGDSRVEHVVFEGLSTPSRGGWSLTGAVTFYESPVAFDSVQFLNPTCEDGLNLVRSTFSLDRCTFSHTFSDAFDADFSDGTIQRTSFTASGNDSVDVSGSVVTLTDIVVTDCGDKAVSAGEASHVTIQKLEVRGSNIGVASKDASDVLINGALLERCRIGLTAFQKKPEFGPGLLRAFGVTFDNMQQDYLIEQGSTLRREGKEVPPNTEDARGILYE